MNNYTEWHDMYHHGTKGQKWGLRRAKWYPIAAFRKSQRVKKKPNSKVRKETPDELKTRIQKTNNVKLAYKNRKLFSNQEINDIVTRSETEKRLGDIVKREKAEADAKKQATEKRKSVESKETVVYQNPYLNHTRPFSKKEIDLRNDIIKNTDLKRAMKNKSLFTTQELTDIVTRAETEKKLDDFITNNKSAGAKVKKFMKDTNAYSSEIATFASNVDKIYKTGATMQSIYSYVKKAAAHAK